jgi:hypothetical protein
MSANGSFIAGFLLVGIALGLLFFIYFFRISDISHAEGDTTLDFLLRMALINTSAP